MANRKRQIVLRVPVTPEERAILQQKMAQARHKNFSAYARKMLIDGYIVHMDTSDIRAQTAEPAKNRRQRQPDCKAYQQYRGCVRAGRGGHQGGAGTDMAVTKIHPIKVNLKAALDYIENPDKTDDKMLVSSFGCSYETADIEFQMLLDQAFKKGNNLAHHLIQAFEPGETTPEQAHEIGRQACR